MASADDLYREILTDGPSPKTLYHLLSKLKKDGQLKRVIQESLKALTTYPNDIHIRRLLAETYFEVGFISQAEGELERVAELLGELAGTYRLQAEIYMKQNRKEEATKALEIYLAHRPDDQEAQNLLHTLWPEEEVLLEKPQLPGEEIPTSFEEETVQEAPVPEEEGFEIATPTLAEIYFEQGQIEEAIRTYEIVVAQNPEDEPSKERLEALRALTVEEQVPDDKRVDQVTQKKEKMISILKSWLANIQRQSHPAEQ